ncbi:MAG: glycosyltransferase [Spirochaetales bacterium]|nr:glycosyltransferase [Spirochaetia bacterium]MDD7460487.1 glycosyltransferase [Spirochaetales bacterium]
MKIEFILPEHFWWQPMNKFAFVIPVYRHGSTLDKVVSSLLKFNYPVIVVDDGNGEEDKKYISQVAEKYACVVPVWRKKNGGKGRAVSDGVLKAHELGITHVFQIDSDGQHDVSRVEYFLELSEKNPHALILSYPEYDASVPSSRLKARQIADTWIHIVTLSNEVKDCLIGFRIYPVEPYYSLLAHHALLDSHMGFDADIIVRFMWKGIPLIQNPVKVLYPEGGISNFRVVLDNVHISITYAKLCIGMFFRLPVLLYRKIYRGLNKNV